MKKFGIRPASPEDARRIYDILREHAEKGLLLKRDIEDIRSRIDNFFVAESKGEVIGCCALRNFGNNLHEIRSLAVDAAFFGMGAGTELVRHGIRLVSASGNERRRLFALTYRPGLFERQGFRKVEKDIFPEKIWHDCRECPKKDCCDETAVLLEL